MEQQTVRRNQHRVDARKRAQEKAEEYLDQLSVEEQAQLIRYESPEIERLGIPEYNWWNEALHGVARAGTATVFPVPIAMASTFHRELIREVGDLIAQEARAKFHEFSREKDFGIYKGLTFWSPNLNLFRDPRWGRGHETFGEDPYLTAQMGAAIIVGIQGEDENFLKAAACVKHFAVHSGPEALRHEFDARVSEKDLWESYLPAFEYCVIHGEVEGAMGGYSSLNGSPLCGNYRLIEEILRGKWGFEGYYVSDCWALRDFHEHHKVTKTPEESAALGLNAGCDINCGNCYEKIMNAYEKGLITKKTIRRSAKRALTTRLLLGMGQKTPWDDLTYRDVDTPKAEELNYRAAAESVVLLKNNGVLPLQRKDSCTIGVIGPNADSTTVLQGNYHGTASHFVSVMEGMKQAVRKHGNKNRLLYTCGCEIMEARTERLAEDFDRLSEARAVSNASDVILLCVGLNERYEGEAHHISTGECMGGDKTDLQFPESQQRLIEAVIACEKPVILCCMSGSCMDFSPYVNQVSAILQAWYPGALGGQVIADIVMGVISPSGKLPVTFYGGDYELPDFTDYSLHNRTYRYVEKGVLFPFGFGLTYGRSQMKEAAYLQQRNCVVCCIRNLSDIGISEVIQVYKRNPDSIYEVKNSALCGFIRVELAPGEEQTAEVQLDSHTFTVVNEEGKRIQDGNRYLLYVGTHGPDEKSRELAGSDTLEILVLLE